MFKLFGRNKIIEFKAPVYGKAVSLTAVPDEVFATKMIGDGIAFEPLEGVVFSPVNGVVESIFPTGHAIGIRTPEDLKVIIHIGIDSVNLNGNGFQILIHENNFVKTGEKLLEFDIDLLNLKAKSIIIPVVITNMSLVKSIDFKYGLVNVHTTVMRVQLK